MCCQLKETVTVSKSGKVESSVLNYLWFVLVVTERDLKLKIRKMKMVFDCKVQMLQKEVDFYFCIQNDGLIEF